MENQYQWVDALVKQRIPTSETCVKYDSREGCEFGNPVVRVDIMYRSKQLYRHAFECEPEHLTESNINWHLTHFLDWVDRQEL